MKEEKSTHLDLTKNSENSKIVTAEEIHADIHKQLKEDMRLFSVALSSLSKVLETTKFSYNNLNEQTITENSINKIKGISRRLRKRYGNTN